MRESFDVVVCGGGPAGLAAAITAAERRLSVLVLERRAFPPDKACGEGLLPPAVQALDRLGALAHVPPGSCHRFRAVRFIQEDGSSADAMLPREGGLGIRRTVLAEALGRRASDLGVMLRDRCAVRSVDRRGVEAVVETEDGAVFRPPRRRRRRPSFAAATSRRSGALAGAEAPLRASAALSHRALERLRRSLRRREGRSRRDAGLLIGDAAGFVDSISADGLSIAFNSALLLGRALPQALSRGAARSSFREYERGERRLFRSYWALTNGLLWIAEHPRFRRSLIHVLGRHPSLGRTRWTGRCA